METLIKDILTKEKIEYETITKATSGFTNDVYIIDNKLVIKLAKEGKDYKLLKELAFYQNCAFDFMPKLVASGNIKTYPYLIITKVPGTPLYSIWHTLTAQKRTQIIHQIADILKAFHNIKTCDFFEPKYNITNWLDKWQKSFALNISILEDKGLNTTFIKDFTKRLPELFSEQKLGLVYNDAHFDNFILDRDKLYIIDFDRAMFCSIDYEMLIMKSMLDNPCKFASEIDEPNVKQEDYDGSYKTIKNSYPELFDFEYIDDRIYIYQFIYYLGQSFEYHDIERTKSLLSDFEKHFS